MSSSPDHIATLYRFCAQSMRYPDASWFTSEYLDSLAQLLTSLGGEEERKALKISFQNKDSDLERLQVEHTRLFINGVPHVTAPPYGSVYLEKTLRGKYSDKVLQYYHEGGYQLTADADLPDSIVHQLEFLSLLAQDQQEAKEKEFLEKFFLPWFPQFAQRVRKHAEHPFYPVIISLIDFFIKEDEEYGV